MILKYTKYLIISNSGFHFLLFELQHFQVNLRRLDLGKDFFRQAQKVFKSPFLQQNPIIIFPVT